MGCDNEKIKTENVFNVVIPVLIHPLYQFQMSLLTGTADGNDPPFHLATNFTTSSLANDRFDSPNIPHTC